MRKRIFVVEDEAVGSRSQIQQSSVVAAMHDGVVVQSESGAIVESNLAAQRMLGLSADQLAGRSSLDPRWRCVHEDGTPFPGQDHPAMVTLRTGAPTTDVVMGVHRPGGDLVWISINSAPLLRPGDGAVIGAVTSFADITARKLAEANLRATEHRLAMVLDNVTDGFFTLDRQWRYTDINPAGARMVGHTPETLVGRIFLEVFPEAAGSIWERTYREVMSTGAPTTVEDYYAPLDQWFEASVFPFAGGISVIFRDISVRKRAERVLQSERERLKRAEATAHHGSWELDLATNEIWWSDEMFRIQGLEPGAREPSFEVFLEAVHPDDRALVTRSYERLGKHEPYDTDHRFRMPDGRVKHLRSRVRYLLDESGRPLLAAGTIQDVTELRQAEERIAASLLEKETLLREIHHRVKNNLQVIAGLLHFQAKKVHAPEQAAAFAELRQRIVAMTLLHERLYQSGDVTEIAFGDYLRALVAEQLRSAGPREGILLDVISDDVQLPIELATPAALLVSELVTNVLKYAFPAARGGRATVSVRRVGDRIVLGVDDDGVGFPDGIDPTSGGSFGWELVRGLTRQLGGTIETPAGPGAHVRVSFPASSARPSQEGRAA